MSGIPLPTATIDHVIVVVADLEQTADRLLRDHGLASLPGGRHPGHGTGNRIVPLGPDYLELMAVVDPTEAASSPLGRWATQRANGKHLVPGALCLRVPDIDPIAAALGEPPLSMSRRTPDDIELSWHLVGLDGMLATGTPFFIRWRIPLHQHPGRSTAPHRVRPTGITTTAGWPIPDTLRSLLDGVDGLGPPTDPRRVVIGTDDGSITLG